MAVWSGSLWPARPWAAHQQLMKCSCVCMPPLWPIGSAVHPPMKLSALPPVSKCSSCATSLGCASHCAHRCAHPPLHGSVWQLCTAAAQHSFMQAVLCTHFCVLIPAVLLQGPDEKRFAGAWVMRSAQMPSLPPFPDWLQCVSLLGGQRPRAARAVTRASLMGWLSAQSANGLLCHAACCLTQQTICGIQGVRLSGFGYG